MRWAKLSSKPPSDTSPMYRRKLPSNKPSAFSRKSRRYVPSKLHGFLRFAYHAKPVKSGDSGYNFNGVEKAAVSKYANVLHRLIFAIVRRMSPTNEEVVKYPDLDPAQQEVFKELVRSLEGNEESAIDDAFQAACYTIFAHYRTQYPTGRDADKFFSPVNAFVVYAAIHEGGSFRKAGVITQTLAAIIYSIRATMLFKILEISAREQLDVFTLVFIHLYHLFSYTDDTIEGRTNKLNGFCKINTKHL